MTIAALILAAAVVSGAAFCPSAPSPLAYQETLTAFSKGPSGKFDQTHSAQTVQKIVEKGSGRLLGWLYLDEYAWPFVGLTAYPDPRTYRWFHLDKFNKYRKDVPTESLLQPTLRLPPWAELQRC